MAILVGIDGGGSKTVCVVGDGSGRHLGRGQSGPSNYLKEGIYTTKFSLRESLTSALREAGLSNEDVSVLCAGLAGMDRPRDREVLHRVVHELTPGARTLLVNDALIALAGATEERPGVIVLSGTGSIVLGVDPQGRQARAGGWGHILGDEGSAYDIARRGLTAALRDRDGRGPSTRIGEKLLEELYLSRIEELIPLLYGEPVSASKIAALFPLVLEAADEGDPVAVEILSGAVQGLIEAAEAVVSRLDFGGSSFPLALSGGVFRHGRLLRSLFVEEVERRLEGARLQDPKMPPEMGAVLLARAALEDRKLFASQHDR